MRRLKQALSAKERDLQNASDTAALLTARIDTARDPERAQVGVVGARHASECHILIRQRTTAACFVQAVAQNLDAFDERGRAMYGEAWDEGMENGLPLR